MINEKQEIQLAKLIIKNCQQVKNTNTMYDGGYVIGDIFELIYDINNYYLKLKKNDTNNT